LPAGSTIANGDLSDAEDINVPLADIAADLNTPRPISSGGTGATNAADARANLGISSDLFPAGGIILWSGSVASIPSGWAICNGSNGTPDLRDRFIVGAGNTYAVADTGGQTAITSVPAHTHAVGTLAAASGGAHTHTVTDPGHTHGLQIFTETSGSGGGSQGDGRISPVVGSRSTTSTWSNVPTDNVVGSTRVVSGATGISISSDGAHTHTISGSTASTGSASVDVRPPYYALAYIMKL
jgi:hypothetical protein